MIPGWQDVFSKNIWNATRTKCGYNFKYHYINADKRSGLVVGKCRCGSRIDCVIHAEDNDIVAISCTTTQGNGESCRKTYLRKPIRSEVAEELMHKSTYQYRIDEANKLMKDGDPEPAIIPKSSVLRVAKSEYRSEKLLHKDPVQALQKMYGTTMKNTIHSIGLEPFYVHYSTKHQHTLYRTMNAMDGTSVAIDATGALFKPISKLYGKKSNSIFLYICVAHNDKTGQVSTTQMISERHDTLTVNLWLNQWIEGPGLPIPKEVVCDASIAILAAAVRAFTNCQTIDSYADACMEEVTPACFIRIDVAHFIKKYVGHLKDVRPKIKQFYLAVIGQLILSPTIEHAERIVRAIITVACSETEGMLNDGSLSPCEIEKSFLMQMLSSTENCVPEGIEDSAIQAIIVDNEDDNSQLGNNELSNWAKRIHKNIMENIEGVEGSGINAHWHPRLIVRLLSDLKWLPLWSCVAVHKFRYGRIPASSTHVEAEFKIIKRQMLQGHQIPMRVDEFVNVHVDSISGIAKFKDAEMNVLESGQNENVSEESLENQEPEEIQNENNDPMPPTNPSCPACSNGDEPSGAHKCAICNINVHALDLCSLPYKDDEEGYGQRRICSNCKQMKNTPKIIESRAIENWRGLGISNTRETSSRYLRNVYATNEFLVKDALHKIPLFKNGGEICLKAIRSGGEKIDISNTCAFDSLFQLFLTGAIDHSDFFANAIEKHASSDNFFGLVKAVKERGITVSAYQFRGKILCDIFVKTGREDLGCYQLQCETNIATLTTKIFHKAASFHEICCCENGCENRIVKLPLAAVSGAALKSKSPNVNIEQEISLENDRKCFHKSCQGQVTVQLVTPEPYVIFEIIENTEFRLGNLPKAIKLSMMDNTYELLGVVEFQAPKNTRQGEMSFIGHYIPITYRNGTFFRYDPKEKRCASNYKTTIELIIFGRWDTA